MKKNKLIELYPPEVIVQCDTKGCDYDIKNPDLTKHPDLRPFVNLPCPKCGGNLLTVDDYRQWIVFKKFVNKINKWFGWIAFFIPKKYMTVGEVKCHNGIHYKENK